MLGLSLLGLLALEILMVRILMTIVRILMREGPHGLYAVGQLGGGGKYLIIFEITWPLPYALRFIYIKKLVFYYINIINY